MTNTRGHAALRLALKGKRTSEANQLSTIILQETKSRVEDAINTSGTRGFAKAETSPGITLQTSNTVTEVPSHMILSKVHAGASRADSSPKDLLAIKAGRGSYSSPSVGHTSASKSIGEAIKNAKKTSPTPLTPGSPIIKRGSRGARRSSSQATDFNFSEAQVGTRYNMALLCHHHLC